MKVSSAAVPWQGFIVLLVGLFSLFSTSVAFADTVTLQQGVNGYSGTTDTYVDVWSPSSNRSNSSLYVRQMDEAKALIKFDLGSIPSGSTVSSAVLELYAEDVGYAGSGQISIHRILPGVSWLAGQANWNSRTASSQWSAPGMLKGTDYESIPVATLSVPSSGEVAGWRVFSVTNMVSQWLSGTENNGFVLRIEASPHSKYFASAEAANISLRPKLTIVYTPGTGPVVTPTPTPTPTPTAPTVTISNPTSVTSGGTATVSWSASNATTCTGNGGISGTNGSITTPALTSNATYTVTCTGGGGSVSQSVTVTVTAATSPSPSPVIQNGNFSTRPYLFRADEERLRASISAGDPEAIGTAANNQGQPLGFLTLIQATVQNRSSYSDIPTWQIAFGGWLLNNTTMLDLAKNEAMNIVNSSPGGDRDRSSNFQHVEDRLLTVAATADLAYSRFSAVELERVATWVNGTLDNWNTNNVTYWPFDNPYNNYWQNGFLAHAIGGIATEGFNPRAGEWRTKTLEMADKFTAAITAPDWSGPVAAEGHYYSTYVSNALWAMELYDAAMGTRLVEDSGFSPAQHLDLVMFQTRPNLTEFFHVGSEANQVTAPHTVASLNYWNHLIYSGRSTSQAREAKAILNQVLPSAFWSRSSKGFSNFYWNMRSVPNVSLTTKDDRFFVAPTPGTGYIGIRSSHGFSTNSVAAAVFANSPSESHANPDAPGFQWAVGSDWIVTDPDYYGNSGLLGEAGSLQGSGISNIVTLLGHSRGSANFPIIQYAEDNSSASIPNYYVSINAQPQWSVTNTYRRQYVWLDDLRVVLIHDRIVGGPQRTWQIHVPSSPTISGNSASFVTGSNLITIRDLTNNGPWSSLNLNGSVTSRNVWKLSQVSSASDYTSIKVMDINNRVTAANVSAGNTDGEYVVRLTIDGAEKTVRFFNSGSRVQIDGSIQTTSSDTTLPTISLTSPAALSTVSGVTTLAASASDNVGVTGVQFMVSNNNVGPEDTIAPYSLTWDSTQVADGTYTVTARVRDAAGNIATTPSRSITVRNAVTTTDTTSPVASLTAPLAGATLSGTAAAISAHATDNVGMAGVTFRIDGVALPEDTTYPYGLLLNTTQYQNGSHTLTATARDQAGNTVTTSATTFSIQNVAVVADTSTPTTPTNLMATARSSSQIDLTWTHSADNLAVTGYVVERCAGVSCNNWSTIGTVTANAYGDTGLSANTTYQYRLRATDAAGNRSGYSAMVSATTAAKSTGGGGGGGGKKPRTAPKSSAWLTPEPTTVTTVTTSAYTPTYTTAGTPTFTKSLYIGLEDPEVLKLQQFLIKQGFLAADSATGLYGPATSAAVKKYQCARGIVCSGDGASTGYGLVGNATRTQLNREVPGIVTTPTTITPTTLTPEARVALIQSLLQQVQVLMERLRVMRGY